MSRGRTSWPVSRILFRPATVDRGRAAATIPSGHTVAGCLERPTRRLGEQPSDACQPTSATFWPCFGWGLPSHPVTRDAGALLPHRFTLTTRRVAVCSLWHCPASHLGLPLAITLLCEVRTFLDSPGEPRPPGQLVRLNKVPLFAAELDHVVDQAGVFAVGTDGLAFGRPERAPVSTARCRAPGRPARPGRWATRGGDGGRRTWPRAGPRRGRRSTTCRRVPPRRRRGAAPRRGPSPAGCGRTAPTPGRRTPRGTSAPVRAAESRCGTARPAPRRPRRRAPVPWWTRRPRPPASRARPARWRRRPHRNPDPARGCRSTGARSRPAGR